MTRSWVMRNPATVSWCVFGVFVLAITGCGTPVGQVAGKITYKSKPAGNARLHWTSVADPELTFTGISDDQGMHQTSYRTYSGLPVGKYRLKITHASLTNTKGTPSGEEAAALRASGKISSESYAFDKEIVAGKNVLDFELTDGKKLPPESSDVKVVP